MAIKSLAQADIKGKKVLIRFDFNVPLIKKILQKSLTLQELMLLFQL